MNIKPTFPNNYKINNDIIIDFRLASVKDFEIYLLENGKFLYVFNENTMNIPDKNRQKYSIFNKKVKNKDYGCFILNHNYETKIDYIVNKLVNLTGLDAVIGMQDLKHELITNVIIPLQKIKEYEKYKISPPNGILLYGPPGCGKTFIVQKLAEEINYTYYELKHSDFASPYVHGSVAKIANIFNEAKKNAPAIIFIDELDGLVPNRYSITENNLYKMEEINEFLLQLNKAVQDGILVIGATNKVELLDSAVIRAGRFDKKIYVSPPDFDARIGLFQYYLDGRPTKNIDFDTLAGQTINYSCSDIELIANESARYTVANQQQYITMEILINTIQKIPTSLI